MKIDLVVLINLTIVIIRVSFERLVAAGHRAGEAGAVGVGYAAIHRGGAVVVTVAVLARVKSHYYIIVCLYVC